MKELIDILKYLGHLPVLIAGYFTIGMFALSLIPSLAFIPKAFILFTLTH